MKLFVRALKVLSAKYIGVFTIISIVLLTALAGVDAVAQTQAEVGAAYIDIASGDKNERENTIRVQVTTDQQANIISRINGKIASIHFLDGEVFRKDDVLIEFDCRELQAKLDQAKARAQLHLQKYASFKELYDLGGANKVELNVLESEMKEAKANLTLSEIYVDYCTIKAPFDGIVSQLDVKPYQAVSENTNLMLITNNDELQLEMLIPSEWMAYAKVGTRFTFKLDDIARSYPAEIKRIGGRYDPVTQTVKIYGALKEKSPELRAGMTGIARFDFPETAN